MHEIWSGDLAPLIFVAAFGVAGWLGYPIVQALRRRIEGRDLSERDQALERLTAAVAGLRAQMDLTAASGERLEELEQRLDFAERMLTSGPPAGADVRE